MSARMPLMGILDCPTCSQFPFAFQKVSFEISHCKGLPEVFLGRWFATFTIATVTFDLSWMNGQSLII